MTTTLEPPPTPGRRLPSHVKRYRMYLATEISAAWLYRELAAVAEGESPDILERLAQTEDDHADHWRKLIAESGYGDLPEPRVAARERILAVVARRFGVGKVLPLLVRFEAAEATRYVSVPEAPTSMAHEEIRHGRTLANLGATGADAIARREARHRTTAGGALRAATFGVNDGLVSNLALVIGVSAGSSDPAIVLLAGIAGLIAGAMSMAAGEWVSVRSQRELYEREIEIEAEEIRAFPDEERNELELIYRAKGLGEDEAKELAERIFADKDSALETLTREELGLDPNELGSPWVAAGSSFVSFAVGAAVPVLPFLFASGSGALVTAMVLSAVALAAVGAAISVLTGKSFVRSALRMVLIGAVASGVTYGIGRAVGIAIA